MTLQKCHVCSNGRTMHYNHIWGSCGSEYGCKLYTNHAYFNLNGHDSSSMEDPRTWYSFLLYSGKRWRGNPDRWCVEKVAGTRWISVRWKRSVRISAQTLNNLSLSGGYDHNFVLDKADGTMQLGPCKIRGIQYLHGCLYGLCHCPVVCWKFHLGNRQEKAVHLWFVMHSV